MRQVSEYWQRIAGRSDEDQPRPKARPAGLNYHPSRFVRAWRGFVWAGTNWPATVATLLFLVSAMTYAAVLGGQFAYVKDAAVRLTNGAAGAIGLSALNVSVTGLNRATREDILAIVGVEEGGSIVEFDARGARQRLEGKDWIASASILRQFPNTLHIEIVEREPFALWQYKGEFSVIDRAGVRLSRFAVRDHLDLPIVVGRGAETQALGLVNQLEAWTDIRSQIRAAVRVAERRWNLYFSNGIKVLLPEGDVDQALEQLDRLRREQDLMNRAVEIVDLRSPERTVLRLSDDAAKARKVELAKVSKR